MIYAGGADVVVGTHFFFPFSYSLSFSFPCSVFRLFIMVLNVMS